MTHQNRRLPFTLLQIKWFYRFRFKSGIIVHNTVHLHTTSDILDTFFVTIKCKNVCFWSCNEELNQQKQIVRTVQDLEKENPPANLSKLTRNENICRKFPSPLLLSKMAYWESWKTRLIFPKHHLSSFSKDEDNQREMKRRELRLLWGNKWSSANVDTGWRGSCACKWQRCCWDVLRSVGLHLHNIW